jgi:uncharacterized protein (DUF58 family)
MRLTTRGLGLLAAAAALLGTGFAFGYPELTLLGTAAAVAVGWALGHAAWRPRLDVTRVADPDRVIRGEASTVTLTVRNTSRLRVTSLLAEDRCGGRAVPVPLLRLRPQRDTSVSYPVPTQRRGVVPIGPLRVARRDPLGLVDAARSHGDPARVWVHPRVYPLTAVPAGIARSLDGRVDRVPHGSITFDTLREYVVGDELRRVHWRTSARVGELMVREHLDTSLPRVVVLLDDRPTAHPDLADGIAETFESACEAAASVIAAAVREDLPVTLHLVTGATATPSPGGGTRRCLDLLAEATLGAPAVEHPLRVATTRLRQQRLGDTLVFLTGPGGRGDLGLIGALRGPYPSVVVGVFGDRVPPAAGPATVGLLVLDATDSAEFATSWDGVRVW